MTALASRIAGAPISWGVCEVPGWGYQMTPEVVLAQMSELGLMATEFGPDGFLPDRADKKLETLTEYGLRAVGQFVPVVLHDPKFDPLPHVRSTMDALTLAQADTVVIAAATGQDGYDSRPQLDDAQWATLLHNLDRIDTAAAEVGLRATVHPHVGTMIETGDEVQRVIDGSQVALCLDTGHILIGGGDPVMIAEKYPERIGHVHLKDVRDDLAAAVRSGAMTYADAVRAGMYVALGEGDVPIERIVNSLEAQGYSGWYVLEQDTMLEKPPGDSTTGPICDVSASVNYLMSVATA